MKKILSLFVRDIVHRARVTSVVEAGAEWVIAGEGRATRKWDGTAICVKGGKLYKRYDAKRGKAPPEGFEPAQEFDPVTGHWPGWIKVELGLSENQYLAHAWEEATLEDGTYEFCGPKVNGNPEHLEEHTFFKHGACTLEEAPRTYDALLAFFTQYKIEGLVWHHADGRMVKIKARDFGIAWPR